MSARPARRAGTAGRAAARRRRPAAGRRRQPDDVARAAEVLARAGLERAASVRGRRRVVAPLGDVRAGGRQPRLVAAGVGGPAARASSARTSRTSSWRSPGRASMSTSELDADRWARDRCADAGPAAVAAADVPAAARPSCGSCSGGGATSRCSRALACVPILIGVADPARRRRRGPRDGEGPAVHRPDHRQRAVPRVHRARRDAAAVPAARRVGGRRRGRRRRGLDRHAAQPARRPGQPDPAARRQVRGRRRVRRSRPPSRWRSPGCSSGWPCSRSGR